MQYPDFLKKSSDGRREVECRRQNTSMPEPHMTRKQLLSDIFWWLAIFASPWIIAYDAPTSTKLGMAVIVVMPQTYRMLRRWSEKSDSGAP